MSPTARPTLPSRGRTARPTSDSALAEHAREAISERIKAALAAAKARGKRLEARTPLRGLRGRRLNQRRVLKLGRIPVGDPASRQYSLYLSHRMLRRDLAARAGNSAAPATPSLVLTVPKTILSLDMLIPIICPACRHIGAVSAARLPRKLVCFACNASHVFDLPATACITRSDRCRRPRAQDTGQRNQAGLFSVAAECIIQSRTVVLKYRLRAYPKRVLTVGDMAIPGRAAD